MNEREAPKIIFSTHAGKGFVVVLIELAVKEDNILRYMN